MQFNKKKQISDNLQEACFYQTAVLLEWSYSEMRKETDVWYILNIISKIYNSA